MTTEPTELADRVALITGASSGIGRATALELARAGMRTVLTARRADRLEELAREIREAGSDTRTLVCDISDRGSVLSMAEEAVDSFGHVDALVNNAGVMPNAPIRESRLDDWEAMVDVNIKGVLYTTHAMLGEIVKRTGHVINVGSVAGRRVFPGGAVYCGTKHFVHAFSEGLRNELTGTGVRVTIIAPGLVKTELQSHIPHEASKERMKKATFEWLHAEDIARAIRYALEQPAHVDINEILVRPTDQEG
jgi:NADP-dependent 3-hydroxy acid dehydrogenase YdfG